jgi:DNA-binding Lrp family transcriptional regulator
MDVIMDEVKKEVKKNYLFIIYNLIRNNKNPSQIAKELKISKQKLNYYIKKLKNEGYIEKIGYGVWRSKKVTKDTLFKEVRGHAFIWKLRVPKIKNWANRLQIISKKNIKYSLVGLKKTPRIIINDKKVWLGDRNIIIYDSGSYYGHNAIDSRKYAVYRFLTVVRALESKLGINLKPYTFKPSRQHYSLINNDLAIQCNRDGTKLNIKHYGETWFIIDNSYNLEEAETIHPDTALVDNVGVQKYFNSHKDTGFKVTPEFVLNTLNKINEIQVNNQKQIVELQVNIKSHLKLIKTWQKESVVRRKLYEKEINLREDKKQKTLLDYS